MYTNKDSISVVMCTYNGGKYLKEQLDSILNQTYPICELLIQDDGSIDNTITILQEYASKYSCIRLVFNESRLGYNENFRSVLYKAQGKYIALADQDDIWMPDKLAVLADEINGNDMCFSISSYLYPDGHIEKEGKEVNITLERLIFYNFVSGHTVLLRREFLQKIPYWSQSVFFDWWLAINAATLGRIKLCKQELTLHRIHADSATFSEYKKIDSPLMPYINGAKSFFIFRNRQPVISFYSILTAYFSDRIDEKTKDAYRLCKAMANPSVWSVFFTCLLCLTLKDKIYPYKQAGGIMSTIRGVCFPFLYYNTMAQSGMRFC